MGRDKPDERKTGGISFHLSFCKSRDLMSLTPWLSQTRAFLQWQFVCFQRFVASEESYISNSIPPGECIVFMFNKNQEQMYIDCLYFFQY
jgi:hypothetical protein